MKYIKRRKVFPSVFLAAPSVVASVPRTSRAKQWYKVGVRRFAPAGHPRRHTHNNEGRRAENSTELPVFYGAIRAGRNTTLCTTFMRVSGKATTLYLLRKVVFLIQRVD